MTPADVLPGDDTALLLLCDHASAWVPADIAIPPHLLSLHVGVDIGAGPLTRALSARLAAPAILGTVSRLVIDLHRQSDHPALMPVVSDGNAIPANVGADRFDRIARFHAPYHRAIRAHVRRYRPRLIVAIHSFTPVLESDRVARPWHAGILYGRDDRAARVAIDHLRALGIPTGDQQPYSGRVLNATLDRHAEGQGIASLSVEIRNDLIADAAGVDRWCAIVADMIAAVRNGLALNGSSAQ